MYAIRSYYGQSMSALKKTGVSTAIYFVITTAIAAAIGLGMALYIHPGQYISGDLIESAMGSEVEVDTSALNFDTSILNIPASLIGGLLPSNPLGALVGGEMLQVVIVAIIIGIALVSLNKDQSTPMIGVLNSVQAVCMTIA